jgi:hypothetical protein
VLEHTVDPEAVVRRLLDIVSATGTLILTVPDGREDHLPAKEYHSEFESYAGHINFWSLESWRYFLARIAPERTLRTGQLPTGHLFAALTQPIDATRAEKDEAEFRSSAPPNSRDAGLVIS